MLLELQKIHVFKLNYIAFCDNPPTTVYISYDTRYKIQDTRILFRYNRLTMEYNKISYNILPLTHFREMLWTRTPLNWRQMEGCESHEWKEQHTRTRPNSSITHQK